MAKSGEHVAADRAAGPKGGVWAVMGPGVHVRPLSLSRRARAANHAAMAGVLFSPGGRGKT